MLQHKAVAIKPSNRRWGSANGSRTSTVARFRRTRRHSWWVAELGYVLASVCSLHDGGPQMSVHPRTQEHPEPRCSPSTSSTLFRHFRVGVVKWLLIAAFVSTGFLSARDSPGKDVWQALAACFFLLAGSRLSSSVCSSPVLSAASTYASWLALSSCSTLSGVVTFGVRETVAPVGASAGQLFDGGLHSTPVAHHCGFLPHCFRGRNTEWSCAW